MNPASGSTRRALVCTQVKADHIGWRQQASGILQM